MYEEPCDMAQLHEALFHAITSPIVAVNRSGSIVEWNRAAEVCTGIPRNEAIGSELWRLQARIAPATIPYEQALQQSHDAFDDWVTMSIDENRSWLEEYESEILTPRGEVHHLHTEIFPLRLRDQLFFVGVLTPEYGFHRRGAAGFHDPGSLPEQVMQPAGNR
jgi:PAS domain S-box-containing protein